MVYGQELHGNHYYTYHYNDGRGAFERTSEFVVSCCLRGSEGLLEYCFTIAFGCNPLAATITTYGVSK
jgi:hypothetical protein